jgi:hypothetical protein
MTENYRAYSVKVLNSYKVFTITASSEFTIVFVTAYIENIHLSQLRPIELLYMADEVIMVFNPY